MVNAKVLIPSKYASNTAVAEYTAPTGKSTIIDKFTAMNTDAGTVTLTAYIVPAGGTASDANLIIKDKSLATGSTTEFTDIKNHILGPGEALAFKGSVADKIVVRVSGREVS